MACTRGLQVLTVQVCQLRVKANSNPVTPPSYAGLPAPHKGASAVPRKGSNADPLPFTLPRHLFRTLPLRITFHLYFP